MRGSIKRQISVIFIGLVVAILLISLGVNAKFLGQYYILNKQASLTEVYEKLKTASEKGKLTSDSTVEELSEMVEIGNITLAVVSGKEKVRLSIAQNEQKSDELVMQLIGYMLGRNQENGTLLKESDTYQIHSAKDVQSGYEYIEMWGYLEDGSTFILRSPLESIRESVALSNKFLSYIVVVVVLISTVLVWYFSKRIADPIMELAVLSKRMADLDFDAKYTSGGDNEIGVLGENFNAMSEKLEQTISMLKKANYELQKDIEKKEKMENMRNEFLGNVSHELKTPIALIQGYAEGLKEGISDDPESRAFYCDVIMDEAGKMNRMVKNLLTLNQLEFGEEEVSFERFDIAERIRGVVQSCEILIQQKNATVHFTQNEPAYVWADEFKAEQVIRNYVSNALNHVEGQMLIDIRISKGEEPDTTRVSVFNTGKQIPKEDIGHIWDKFYKVDKAHTREYGGNGIGLSIVKAIMESFHHEYGVNNYENGVEFWFELSAK